MINKIVTKNCSSVSRHEYIITLLQKRCKPESPGEPVTKVSKYLIKVDLDRINN